jgi:hypothetical protein
MTSTSEPGSEANGVSVGHLAPASATRLEPADSYRSLDRYGDFPQDQIDLVTMIRD